MNNIAKPFVSVVMPVFNRREFLAQAVESILNQTLTDFELIIVDDCSTDGSRDVIRQFSQQDRRIRVIQNAANQGIAAARNIGNLAARGNFIAIMDSDDIAYPARLEKQVDYLQKNPEVGVCGTWIRYVGATNKTTWKTPLTDDEIRCGMLFGMCFANPTVMFRRTLITEHALMNDPAFTLAEDYDIWSRALEFAKMGNIGEVLLNYRIHPQQITVEANQKLFYLTSLIHKRQLNKIGLNFTNEDLALHNKISGTSFSNREVSLPEIENWLIKLQKANIASNTYSVSAFQQEISQRWALCVFRSSMNLKNLAVVLSSPLKPAGKWGKYKIVFFLKWVLFKLRGRLR